jgi:hypothetical protein
MILGRALVGSDDVRLLLPRGDEERNVATERDLDVQALARTLLLEVIAQPAAKLASVGAHDVVFERAVVERTIEDVYANLVLAYLFGSTLNCLGNDIEEKV